MKNKLTDLNDHLFTALERVNDEDLDSEALRNEINRARSIANLGREIVQNARLVLDGEKYKRDYGIIRDGDTVPAMFSDKPKLEAIDGSKKG